MTPSADDQLILDVQQGNLDAFAPLIESYQQPLYRFALSLLHHPADAEDVVSETLIKAFTALKDFQVGTSFKSWIMTILYRTALDMLRFQNRHPHIQLEQTAEPAAVLSSPLEMLMTTEQNERLLKALMHLKPEERAAVYLYYYQDVAYADIARILGWPMGTVASKLNRCRNKLKRFLEEGK